MFIEEPNFCHPIFSLVDAEWKIKTQYSNIFYISFQNIKVVWYISFGMRMFSTIVLVIFIYYRNRGHKANINA